MTEEQIKDIFVKTNAVMEGHFLLTSGLHSPMYVEKFNVLQHPEYTEILCKELAERFKDEKIDTVVGPMTGGILLAHETGKALGTRAIFTERENGHMTFRRGFHLEKGERVLIVEDIVSRQRAAVFDRQVNYGNKIRSVVGVARPNAWFCFHYGVVLIMSVDLFLQLCEEFFLLFVLVSFGRLYSFRNDERILVFGSGGDIFRFR